MAIRSSALDRNLSFIGNFSVLEGVMVKISDKFKPPKKVSLPVGWQPVDLGKFETFDFTLEEEVIKLANQERLQQERENENVQVAELILETQNETSTSQVPEADVISDNTSTFPGSENQVAETEPVSYIKEAPILEPMKIESYSLIARGISNKQRDFNFSEFEDNSATPFELVELQTLDDLSELKSVLQPQYAKKTTSVRSKASVPSTKNDDDIDFSIFNTPVTTNTVEKSTASQVATASLLQGFETEGTVSLHNVALSSGSKDSSYEDSTAVSMRGWGNSVVPPSGSVVPPSSSILPPSGTALPPSSSAVPSSSSIVPPSSSVLPPSGSVTAYSTVNQTPLSNSNVVPLERRFESIGIRENGKGSDYSRRFNATIGPASSIQSPIATVYPVQIPSQPIVPLTQNADFHGQQYLPHNIIRSQNMFTSLPSGYNNTVSNASESSVVNSSKNGNQKSAYTFDIGDSSFGKTNLNRSNSKSLPNLAEASFGNGSLRDDFLYNESHRKSPTEAFTPVVSTSRIDNIMKQFQLNRLREFDEVATTNTSIVTEPLPIETSAILDTSTRPSSRHGILPPLQTSPRNISYSPFTGPPQGISPRGNAGSEKRYPSDDESNKGFGHLEQSKLEKKMSLSEPLPSIRNASPSWKNPATKQSILKQENSWLPDPFSTLSTSDKAYVTMIASMGFPKARTARAVLRLKADEKEIIDFLVRVQQIVEMGYDEDDAEMAVIDNNNDKQSALNYLNLVNKWKELGFPVQKIHNALKNTDKDNEAVIEYLTT